MKSRMPWFVYDLQQKDVSVKSASQLLTVPARGAGFYVLAPEKIPDAGIKLAGVSRGGIDININSPGLKRVFLGLVTDPSGQQRYELRRKVTVSPGCTRKMVVPIALSDPPGEWQIRVVDVVSGRETLIKALVEGREKGRAGK